MSLTSVVTKKCHHIHQLHLIETLRKTNTSVSKPTAQLVDGPLPKSLLETWRRADQYLAPMAKNYKFKALRMNIVTRVSKKGTDDEPSSPTPSSEDLPLACVGHSRSLKINSKLGSQTTLMTQKKRRSYIYCGGYFSMARLGAIHLRTSFITIGSR